MSGGPTADEKNGTEVCRSIATWLINGALAALQLRNDNRSFGGGAAGILRGAISIRQAHSSGRGFMQGRL
jgi:hypothetical protein